MTPAIADIERRSSRPGRPKPSTSGNVTRSLLGYPAVAGSFYVAVSLAQALTRSGFNLAHDEWSLLALGHLGRIQMANLIVAGAMTVAGAVGVRRAIGRSADGGTWAPRLIAVDGVALIGAGLFTADPANGFPAGSAPEDPNRVGWHAGCISSLARSASDA